MLPVTMRMAMVITITLAVRVHSSSEFVARPAILCSRLQVILVMQTSISFSLSLALVISFSMMVRKRKAYRDGKKARLRSCE